MVRLLIDSKMILVTVYIVICEANNINLHWHHRKALLGTMTKLMTILHAFQLSTTSPNNPLSLLIRINNNNNSVVQPWYWHLQYPKVMNYFLTIVFRNLFRSGQKIGTMLQQQLQNYRHHKYDGDEELVYVDNIKWTKRTPYSLQSHSSCGGSRKRPCRHYSAPHAHPCYACLEDNSGTLLSAGWYVIMNIDLKKISLQIKDPTNSKAMRFCGEFESGL